MKKNVVACVTISLIPQEEPDISVATVRVEADCQCPSCCFNHAVMLMGTVMELTIKAESNLEDVMAHAQVVVENNLLTANPTKH